MRISLLSLLIFLNFLPFSYSQDDLEKYHLAKQMIASGEYQEAMDEIMPFMEADRYGELSNYARYHFARAAYENKQFELARTALVPLIEEERWNQREEAKYLLALVNFQQQKPADALKVVTDIQNKELKNEAYKATYEFLKETPVGILMVHVSHYGDNGGLIMALKQQLEKQSSLSSQEREIYNRIKDFEFPDEEEEEDDFVRKVNQTLEIALVLPFNYNGGSGVKRLGPNNFVFELYRGMRLAVEEARKDGLDVVIRTFDTERNPEVIQKIFKDPYFEVADIIVGPIYPEETEIVAKFAEKYKIPFVNPLSNINESISGKDYAYLFRPSIDAISENIVNYCKRFQGNKIAVAYSGTSRDEQLAKTFNERAQRAGFQIVRNQKVTAKEMRNFFEDIASDEDGFSRIDVMVIFSDDPNIASPTFSMVESLSSSTPIIVLDSWLYFNFASYEMMNTQDFHFIGNNTVNMGNADMDKFKEDFFRKYQSYPGLNGYLGYELLYWIKEVINPHTGFDFRNNLAQKGFMEGKLTFGFDFGKNGANTYVPIMRLEEGLLVVE